MGKEKEDKLLTIAFVLGVVGIVIIILWALGKSLGWISSPVWVNMIPVFGGAAGLGAIGIGVGRVLQKVDRVIKDVDKIDNKTDDLSSRVITLETQFGGIELKKIEGLKPETKKED